MTDIRQLPRPASACLPSPAQSPPSGRRAEPSGPAAVHIDLDLAPQQPRNDVGRSAAADNFAPARAVRHLRQVLIVHAVKRRAGHHQQLARAAEVNHPASNVVLRCLPIDLLRLGDQQARQLPGGNIGIPGESVLAQTSQRSPAPNPAAF